MRNLPPLPLRLIIDAAVIRIGVNSEYEVMVEALHSSEEEHRLWHTIEVNGLKIDLFNAPLSL